MRQARPRLPALAVLCALGLLVGWVGIANHDLWTPDEPRVAGIGVEMWRNGSLAVPTLGGRPFLEKPPLYWWTEIGLYHLFGHASAGLARAPSALFAFATLLLTYAWGRRFLSREAALLGGLALLTTDFFMTNTHWVLVDSALLFGTTAALAGYAFALEPRGGRRAAGLLLLYGGLAAAFFSKGLIGIALPGAAIVAHGVWSRGLRDFAGWHIVVGGAAIGALIALWLWRVDASAGPAGVRAFVVHNQLGRFLPTLGGYHGAHQRPFYYYLGQTPANLLPWTPVLLLAAVALRRRWPELEEEARQGARLVLCAGLAPLFLLSLAATKRGVYALPVAPPFALLVGWWMASRDVRGRIEASVERWWRRVVLGLAALMPVVVLVLDWTRWAEGLAGLAVLGAVALLLRRHPVGDDAGRWLHALVLLCVGLAAALVTVPPAYNRLHSRRPVMEDVSRLVPAAEPVHLFRPSEVTIGLVSFYTRHRCVRVEGLAALRALASEPHTSWLLLEGKKGAGPVAEVRQAGVAFRVRAHHATSDRRSLWLVTLGGTAFAGRAAAGRDPAGQSRMAAQGPLP